MATTPSSALLTRTDLDQLPDDGHRYELVDGTLLVSPLARARHQRVVGEVFAALHVWSRENHGVAYPGVNVELAADSHLEPDVAWSADERDPGLGFDHSPALVVEVTSPDTRHVDATIKKDRYAATGCREYWIVDLDDDVVEVFEVTAGVAGDPAIHHRGQQFTSPLFEGLVLDVDELLG